MLPSSSSKLMFLILVECLSAWQNHEVTAAQRSTGGGGGGYHYGGGSLQNSLHHHKGQLYNLNSHHHHHLNSAASALRTSKIDNTFTSKSEPVKRRGGKGGEGDQLTNDDTKGLQVLNRLVMESFIEPTFLTASSSGTTTTHQQPSNRKAPTILRHSLRRGPLAIGRTINSENVGNGSLSRLITSRLVGVSESLMGWVERSVDDLPSIPRLDAQECMKRCICEAHNQPKKYGAVGLAIQLFFPPYLDSEDTTKVVSKYQLAARYGRGENANCSAQYDDCMVNVLDVLQGAIDMIF
ncbi:hypothetical protein TYRP_013689 [Tyrophagus putrescentiae]|nr:hypothetical protein TYRP_013689 [Tyrophagus putrescentiae]